MRKRPDDCRPRDWTGDRDKSAAAALVIALAIGALGFLVIGALTLH